MIANSLKDIRVSLLTYSIYMGILFGNPLCFPQPFSLLPQSVDGGERGGRWDGFDLHAQHVAAPH